MVSPFIGGSAVSGGLAIVDAEYADVWEEYAALVEAESPGLLARLPLIHTPGKDESGGRHLYFRSAAATPTGKLARTTKEDAIQRTGDKGKITLIEVKGEKGYVLTLGCPGACHPSGRTYRHAGGPRIEVVPTLEPGEVEVLLRCARALDRRGTQSTRNMPRVEAGEGGGGLTPWEDYDRRHGSVADQIALLGRHGCRKEAYQKGSVAYLTRPGKDAGVSASVGAAASAARPVRYCSTRVTTNAVSPFRRRRFRYGPYRTLGLRLEQRRDFAAAARDLRKGIRHGRQVPPGAGLHAPRCCRTAPGLGGRGQRQGKQRPATPTIQITVEEYKVNEDAASCLGARTTAFCSNGRHAGAGHPGRQLPFAHERHRRALATRIDPLPVALLRERLTACASWQITRSTKDSSQDVPARPPAWCVCSRCTLAATGPVCAIWSR